MNALTLAPPSNLAGAERPVALLPADEFVVRYDHHRVELIRGIVREMPRPDALHGTVCIQIGRFLDEFAEQLELGRVMSNDSFIKVRENPDTVLGADVCFISFARLPKGKLPQGLLTAVPELVVEVRSPSDRWTEVIAKVLDYLAAGVVAVLVVNPDREAVAIYRAEADEQHFTREDELTIPDVLPGFVLPVRKLFE